MAAKRMMRREQKREQLQRRAKRLELSKQLKDPTLDIEKKFKILEAFEKMPRDSSSVRVMRRCQRTGRAHGVYRKFGLCRNEIRYRAMRGEIPGLVKASW